MKENNKNWSRRSFLYKSASAGALILMNPGLSWAAEVLDPKIINLSSKLYGMGIDTHNHIDVPLYRAELPGPKVDLKSAFKESGLSAICMAFAVDYQKLINPGDAYDRFINGLDAMDIVLQQNGIKRSLNSEDVKKFYKRNEPTVIQSVEGGHFLEGNIERLKLAYDRGLRHLTLLHDNDASVPLGDVFTNPAKFGGLTDFGKEVLKECNKLGILVDLSHGSDAMVNASLKAAHRPVLISHTGLNTKTGLNPSFAKMMMPRLISPEQAKFVAQNGGVIGVWTHLADSASEYADNIRAMVDIAGIDHVCIGTDTKLTPAYRSAEFQKPERQNEKSAEKNHTEHDEGQRRKNSPDTERVGERTNLVWKGQKAGFYYAVTEAMVEKGFTEDEIMKIGGGNYMRIFEQATK